MARGLAPGEKPVYWVGSSLQDLLQFPAADALSAAQFGGKHPAAKPWRGEGPGVLEVADEYRGDAYRAVYTVRFPRAVYVLHAFQKKSHRGRRTDQRDIDLITRRLRLATEDYEARYGG